ncbi:MAG: hypothetical protein IPM45_18210 [Acidimicrobiales bacterium]|nr:hypothetical protein [Acidimicrobiales bacterium]
MSTLTESEAWAQASGIAQSLRTALDDRGLPLPIAVDRPVPGVDREWRVFVTCTPAEAERLVELLRGA